MPFGKRGTKEFDDNQKIYRQMIKPVAEVCGYACKRADELKNGGNITRDIIEQLWQADLVIADLTGRNANVFYELGVRHALFKCGTIPILRDGETLPFDIAPYRTIFYSTELDGPKRFKAELKEKIFPTIDPKNIRTDNPVHDFLGDKLQPAELKSKELQAELDQNQKRIQALETEKEALKAYWQQNAQKTEQELMAQIAALNREKDEALAKGLFKNKMENFQFNTV